MSSLKTTTATRRLLFVPNGRGPPLLATTGKTPLVRAFLNAWEENSVSYRSLLSPVGGVFRWLVPSKGKMLFGYQRCATGKAPTQPLCEGFRFMSLRNYAGRRGHSVYKTWRRGRESGGRSGVRVLLFPGSTTKRAPTWRFQRAAASKNVLPFIVYYARLLSYSLSLSRSLLPLSSSLFLFSLILLQYS